MSTSKKKLLLALVVFFGICAATTSHAASCPKVDYPLPGRRFGKLSLSLEVKVIGYGIAPAFSCLTVNGQRISARRLPAARRDMISSPGSVVGWVILNGSGFYSLLYRRMNVGSIAFTAQWPLVIDGAGNIEIHPEHPDFKLSYDVKQWVVPRVTPFGNASDVALQFRAPVWKSGAQVAPYVEITVTDRLEPSLGLSLGSLSLPIELSSSSFYTQAKPGFYLELKPW